MIFKSSCALIDGIVVHFADAYELLAKALATCHIYETPCVMIEAQSCVSNTELCM